ncbi:MAG TPA: thymidylate kinase [Candidatus Woesearchaeota archaeon]|nr:thymidylate kinase [Candidatus Woesearchaeota archaeon]
MKGRFLVIEGGDCSGKTTQAELLIEDLRNAGKEILVLDFPTYEDTLGGTTVKWYLEGKFGALDEVPAEVASLCYALDRYQFAKENWKALENGKILIANRYTQSNMGHQGGKFKGKDRHEFIKWVEDVERRMPQPDIVIYLDLPVELSLKLKEQRGNNKGAKDMDIHEKDIQHLKDARECYLETAKIKNWIIIDCKKSNEDSIRAIEDIHDEIIEKLKKEGLFNQ